MLFSTTVVLCGMLAFADASTFVPIHERSTPTEGGTFLHSFVDGNQTISVYGHGELVNVTIPATRPPNAPAHVDVNSTHRYSNTDVRERWSHGIVAVSRTHVGSNNETLPVGKRSVDIATCILDNYWWWGESGLTQGTWWTPWQNTNYQGWNGGTISYCDAIITLPTFSGSIGLNLGIISAALGISPKGATSQGRCYGCTSKDGCWDFWFQKKMNWRNGNMWHRERKYSAGAETPCYGTYERTSVYENSHSDWANLDPNGFQYITPGCSRC